jgi:uncharacterized membrane protein
MWRDLNPDHWKLIIFYYNPDNPRVFVPKRVGLGWTVNFAKPIIWVPGVVLIAAGVYFAIVNNGFWR